MGNLLLFFSASLVIDLYRLLVYLVGISFKKDLSIISLSARTAFVLPLLLFICTSAYGYFEAKDIHVEEVTVRTSKLPEVEDEGSLKLLNSSYLYVSRGAGTWGPPIRFLSPPEVTVIELVREDKKQF